MPGTWIEGDSFSLQSNHVHLIVEDETNEILTSVADALKRIGRNEIWKGERKKLFDKQGPRP